MLTMRPLEQDGTWGAKSKKEYLLDKNGERIEQKQLNGEYVSLKGEVREIEQIRRGVYDIMREENRRTQPARAHDMEL